MASKRILVGSTLRDAHQHLYSQGLKPDEWPAIVTPDTLHFIHGYELNADDIEYTDAASVWADTILIVWSRVREGRVPNLPTPDPPPIDQVARARFEELFVYLALAFLDARSEGEEDVIPMVPSLFDALMASARLFARVGYGDSPHIARGRNPGDLRDVAEQLLEGLTDEDDEMTAFLKGMGVMRNEYQRKFYEAFIRGTPTDYAKFTGITDA